MQTVNKKDISIKSLLSHFCASFFISPFFSANLLKNIKNILGKNIIEASSKISQSSYLEHQNLL